MKVYHQSAFDRWPFDDCSIQAVITSPPYYSLRKYDIPDIIIGGNSECEHEWLFKNNNKTGGTGDSSGKQITCADNGGGFSSSSSCQFCNAWKGQYGLEPTYKLYIEHTLLWCKEAWRVLRDDGSFFLNLGDSWNGSGGDYNEGGLREGQPKYPGSKNSLPSKCLLDIPARVSIALVDELHFIKRNNIIWYSRNKMPESVRDRFSKKHEMVYMFTKSGKYAFYLDAVREEHLPQSIARAARHDFSQHKVYSIQSNRDGEHGRVHENGKNPGDVWDIPTQPSPEKHFAMWPQSLVERMIKCSTKPGDSILDPFCGSGTTLRVADKLNREAYGIDLGYRDIQERRLTNIQKVLL